VISRFVQRLAAVAGRRTLGNREPPGARGTTYLAGRGTPIRPPRAKRIEKTAPKPRAPRGRPALYVTDIETGGRPVYDLRQTHPQAARARSHRSAPGRGPRIAASSSTARAQHFTKPSQRALPADPPGSPYRIGASISRRRRLARGAGVLVARVSGASPAVCRLGDVAARAVSLGLRRRFPARSDIPLGGACLHVRARRHRIARLGRRRATAILDTSRTGASEKQVRIGVSPADHARSRHPARGAFARPFRQRAIASLVYVSLKGGRPRGDRSGSIDFKDGDANVHAEPRARHL